MLSSLFFTVYEYRCVILVYAAAAYLCLRYSILICAPIINASVFVNGVLASHLYYIPTVACPIFNAEFPTTFFNTLKKNKHIE